MRKSYHRVRVCIAEGCGAAIIGREYCRAHWKAHMASSPPIKKNWGSGKTHEERFWSRVEKTEGCWFWMGTAGPRGYGKLQLHGKRVAAHRYSWYLHHGVMPQMILLHKCDNPSCVNPAHLKEGTHADNSRDMVERGRSLAGEKSLNAILTSEQVREIRSRAASTTRTRLANEYRVSVTHIYRILSGKKWKCLL